MHDQALVGGAEGTCDLDRVGDRLRDLQRPLAAYQLLERLTLYVLEHDVRRAEPLLAAVAGGLLAGVDDGDDLGVVQLGDGARLAAKALQLVRVRGDLAVHELDRHGAFEHDVEGAVDARHAAAPDLGIEPVATAEQGPEHGHRPYCARKRAPRPSATPASAAR